VWPSGQPISLSHSTGVSLRTAPGVDGDELVVAVVSWVPEPGPGVEGGGEAIAVRLASGISSNSPPGIGGGEDRGSGVAGIVGSTSGPDESA